MAAQRQRHPEDIPRAALIGIGLLLLLALVGVALVQLAGGAESQLPPSPALSSRELRFEDRSDGSIVIVDARTGSLVQVIEPETNGFLRGTMRALVRDRRREDIGPQTPFVLAARADGRLTIDDPSTGRSIDLASFGPTNSAAFRRLLAPTPPATRTEEPSR